MKNVLATAFVAAAVLGASALPSFAATTNLGTIGDGYANNIGNTKLQGFFSDTFNFTLAPGGSYDTSVSLTLSNSRGVKVNNFSVSLDGSTSSSTGGTGTTVTLADLILAPGTYSIIVSGTSTGTGTGSKATFASYGGPLTVSAVSTVPLPNSVALFGVAVLGLGAFGAMRKKTSAGATA